MFFTVSEPSVKVSDAKLIIIWHVQTTSLDRETNTVFALEMVPARYPGYGAGTVPARYPGYGTGTVPRVRYRHGTRVRYRHGTPGTVPARYPGTVPARYPGYGAGMVPRVRYGTVPRVRYRHGYKW